MYSKITIITPVYNRENLLEVTIRSILNQRYPDLEYIVIDDGSTDSSLKLLRKYEKKIKLISQKNQGEAKTVNNALKIATGEIIGVVNSDDPLLPGSLTELANFFNANPDILVAYPDWVEIDESGSKIDEIKVHEHDYSYMFSSQHCYIGPGAFFTKKALRIARARSLDFKYVSDFEFWLRLGLYGEFKRIPQSLATFRIHKGSQSQYAKGEKMARENIDLVNHIISLPNFPEEINKYIPKAYSSAYFLAGKKAIKPRSKMNYYLQSLQKDPVNFLIKVKYELVKVKHKFLV